MEPFTRLTARAAPLPEDNIDTDVILPARFLLITGKAGLGAHAFQERRGDPAFFLNRTEYSGAEILVTGANFGCGSSREHAPWALADLGLRVIVAPSFGEIFAGNCVRNGMLPATVADVTPVMDEARAGRSLTVDLVERRIVTAAGRTCSFAIDDWAREALLNGWDEVQTILGRHGGAIDAFETRQRAAQPWLWSKG